MDPFQRPRLETASESRNVLVKPSAFSKVTFTTNLGSVD